MSEVERREEERKTWQRERRESRNRSEEKSGVEARSCPPPSSRLSSVWSSSVFDNSVCVCVRSESADAAGVIDPLCPDLGKSCAAFQRRPIFQGRRLKIDIHHIHPQGTGQGFIQNQCVLDSACRWGFIIRDPV